MSEPDGEGSRVEARDHALRRFLVRSPASVSIPAIVAVSVAASVGMLLAMTELMGLDFGPNFPHTLAIAIVVPMVVSAPIGGYVVRLLREVEVARNRAQTLSWIDPLTCLLNRRRMSALAARVLAPERRLQAECTVALVDIDDFKKINDAFGHHVGDRVLECVGRTLREIGGAGMVARWGGEEFVMLMPGASSQEARHRAQALRAAIQGLSIDSGDGQTVRCTVSIGISSAGHLDTFEQMVARADRAMYRAKVGGKNRVAID